MFTEYFDKAMDLAKYEIIERDEEQPSEQDGWIFGSIPGFPGLWACRPTEEECRIELREVLESWVLIKLRDNDEMPEVEGERLEVGGKDSLSEPRVGRKLIELAAQQMLLTLFNQALAVEDDIPILKTVREQIKTGMSRIPGMIRTLNARKKKLESKRSKITSKAPTNVAHMIIDGELKKIAGQTTALENETQVGKACLVMLKSYSEKWEAPEPAKAAYGFRFEDYVVNGSVTRF